MQIQPQLHFGEEAKIVEKDDIVSIAIPSDPNISESDYQNSPAAFLEAIMEPYMPKYLKELDQNFYLYKDFVWSFSLNPFFYRYVFKQTRGLEWINNHRRELTYLLLLDILSDSPPTIKNANQEFEEDYRDEDRTRNRRSLRNDYYPELFFKIDDFIVEKKSSREKQYSTILTENELDFTGQGLYGVPLMISLVEHYNQKLPSEREREQMQIMVSNISNVTAGNIQDALDFRIEINDALDRVLLRVREYDGFRKIIVNEIRSNTELVDQMRIILNLAIFTRWFNGKTIKARRKLIRQPRRMRYTEKEAQKVTQLLLEYTGDEEEVEPILYFGECEFERVGKSKYAKMIKKERKKLERSCLRKENSNS